MVLFLFVKEGDVLKHLFHIFLLLLIFLFPSISLCLSWSLSSISQDTKQTLTIYELDLGLNHVVRKESTPLDLMANKIIAVPGGK